MGRQIVAGEVEAQIQEGRPDVLESRSASEPLMAVFEDDGETGYFYALDLSGTHGQKIADAVQIYSVDAGGQGTLVRVIRIAWSLDGWKAGLLVGLLHDVLFLFAGGGAY